MLLEFLLREERQIALRAEKEAELVRQQEKERRERERLKNLEHKRELERQILEQAAIQERETEPSE